MKNMKIRTKLITGFLLMLALIFVLSAVGIYGVSLMSGNAQHMYDVNTEPLKYVTELFNAIQEERVITSDLALYSDPDKISSLKGKLAEQEARMEDAFAELAKTVLADPVRADYYRTLDNLYHEDYANVKAQILAVVDSDDDRDAVIAVLNANGGVAADMIAALDDLSSDLLHDALITDENNISTGQTLIWVFIALSLIAAAAAVFLTYYISGLIARPARAMVDIAESIALGDVQSQIEVNSQDELGQLAGAFGRMTDAIRTQVDVVAAMSRGDLSMTVAPRSERDAMNISLRDMLSINNEIFSEITRGAENVSAGAKQVADGSQSLAQATTQQAAVVEELAGSIGQISEKTVKNAAMAQEASVLGQKINENAQTGANQMDHMMQAVREINEASQSISKVIKVIDDIAFQTNILALNAAVEAARAGQHGKGFAVVAEEVRSLAAKSAEAAKDTGSLIANSIEKAELGSRIAQETARSLADIVSGIQESGAIVADIARLSDEQASAIAQINKGVDQVSQVVTANSATAEESAAASEEMSSQSTMLSELVSRFKLKEQRPGAREGRISSMAQRVSLPARNERDIDDEPYIVGGNDFGKY